jgi:hypothetical protein
VSEFLVDRGFNQNTLLETNMRAFNHAQRLKLQTDWSFTIFVVNSMNDGEGTFAPGGNFSRAFSFAGGLFQIVPSTRPVSTFTHETGHMFWARDEYIGGGNYFQRRGYYNTQNTNAIDLNPNALFQQEDSIMSEGTSLDRAFSQLVSPDSTLAQIGWVDSDNDGIFDVLDVPLSLEGSGRFDPLNREYRFRGDARVQTLPNLNSSGLQNNITLNRIERLEYRFNDQNWITLSTPNDYLVDLDLRITVPAGITGTIELRAIDSRTGITSNVFSGALSPAWSTTETDSLFGFVWNDQDQDGSWDSLETGIAGATVRLETLAGAPARTQTVVRPGDLPEGQITGNVSGAVFSSIGMDADGRVGAFSDSDAVLDSRVFRPYSWQLQGYREFFRGTDAQLRVTFARPTQYVFVHAIAAESGAIARLDAFDSNGKILARAETPSLGLDQYQGLEVQVQGAEIAYIIAYGHRETAIKIDQLRFGLPAETTTRNDGSFAFPGLSPGNYTARVIPPSDAYGTTSPTNGTTQVVVSASGDLRSDFGLRLTVSPWQNQAIRHDVNNDGDVNLFDVLVVINEINRNGARELQSTDAIPPPFIDVDGNRIVEALDVLIVINFINNQLAGGGGEGFGEGEGEKSSQWTDIDAPGSEDWLTKHRRRRPV